VLEESWPKECEGATVVTVGSPSLLPQGSYLCIMKFITKSKGLGGNTQQSKDDNHNSGYGRTISNISFEDNRVCISRTA
jgi:hypothetical protein